jgi:hypothetical protein
MHQMTNVGHTVEDSQNVGKSAIAHIYSAIPTNTTLKNHCYMLSADAPSTFWLILL